MPEINISEVLGVWEGYHVADATRHPGSVEIKLTPIPGHPGVCSGCQQQVAAVHAYELRRVRDLPILDRSTILVLARRRLACPQCGPKLEHLSWLAPYARVTNRLAESVARLCAVLPIKHVAQQFCTNPQKQAVAGDILLSVRAPNGSSSNGRSRTP